MHSIGIPGSNKPFWSNDDYSGLIDCDLFTYMLLYDKSYLSHKGES
jgi:hypothetical protein